MEPIDLIEEMREVIEADDVERLEELFQLRPPLANASYRPYAERPLIYAAWQNATKCLCMILQYDLHLEATDDNGWTPLIYAVYHQHFESMHILLEAGADPNARDLRQHAPLHIAAARFSDATRREAIDLLVDYGAIHDVGSATRLGSAELLRQLLSENPRAIEEYRNRGELLLDTLFFGTRETASILLNAGADPDWPVPSAYSARRQAIEYDLTHNKSLNECFPGKREIVDMILQAPRKEIAGDI